MDEKDKGVILKLKNNLPADITKHIKKYIVYGSRARGEGGEESDLDILMLVDEKSPKIEQELEDAAYQIMWEHDFRPIISLKIFAEDKFNQALRKGFSFYRNVEREGIVV
ncbi:nucleotidyltransferase domain-containing protein [bacterium]|nr:nucleotidyltransferase domain-containing protein [bacterium]